MIEKMRKGVRKESKGFYRAHPLLSLICRYFSTRSGFRGLHSYPPEAYVVLGRGQGKVAPEPIKTCLVCLLKRHHFSEKEFIS